MMRNALILLANSFFGLALAAGTGAITGYILQGTVRGALFGALAFGFILGKNSLILATQPRLPLALALAMVGGFVGGLCLFLVMPFDTPGLFGGIAFAAIGAMEVLLSGIDQRITLAHRNSEES
jgi:hypothetical protein